MRPQTPTYFSVSLVLVFAYGSLLLLVGFGFHTPLFDRYLLVVVPVFFVTAMVSEVRFGPIEVQRWRVLPTFLLIGIYAGLSVAATHDYVAWNRTRWAAAHALMSSGVPASEIDGGYEFDGWYLSDLDHKRAPHRNGWWAEGDQYVIAAGPLSGYRELQRFDVQPWLAMPNTSILILQKGNSQKLAR